MNRRSFSLVLALTPFMTVAKAQKRPIRLIVPFTPGGSTDVIAREIADAMGSILGTVIAVENRPGAGGSIGTAEVARAAPDGATMGLATQSTHSVNPVVYKKLSYDAFNDFSFIGEIAQAPGVMIVNPKLPVTDLAGFIAYARDHQDELFYASPGNGTIGHVWGEQFKRATNVKMQHVPYSGAAQLLNDMLGGLVSATFTTVTSVLPHIERGKVRALAISWPDRLDILPGVPTYAELGFEQINKPTWFGLVAPAGLSSEKQQELQEALSTALRQPKLQNKYAGQGLFTSRKMGEEFKNTILTDFERTRELSRTAQLAID
ncbi:MAG: Bug family tripartite tricarboxylate transporter substrate binding protein [Advenella sp.]